MEPKSSQTFSDGSCSVPNTNTTTDEIQKILEENKQLILFIMAKNGVGKQKECEMHVAKLQENLTMLTNLADALSKQQPELPPQIPAPSPPPTGHQGHWMPQHEAVSAAMRHQQLPLIARQPQPIQLNDSPQQKQHPSFLQQELFTNVQMGFDPNANADSHSNVRFGAQSGSNQTKMFDAMGTNPDGSIGSGVGNFRGM